MGHRMPNVAPSLWKQASRQALVIKNYQNYHYFGVPLLSKIQIRLFIEAKFRSWSV